MAKQVGTYSFIGTIDGICFYKMEGEYYARKQTSLTGKRFWKAACFQGSRRSCKRLSLGSQLAATVYKDFRKQKGMYAALKSRAITLLKTKTSEEKVVRKLMKLAIQLQPPRSHSSKYIPPYRGLKQETRALASIFSIPPVIGTIPMFNLYLSSA